ncbi:YxeA family protein [Bacillus sp. EAC]|uniref:YxeA family protein n=1 Tax=Bacillus sp. EAC TaxID=1978338 RepID=UPI0015C51880|nr:YxeA family protein [Bacillus sp. EAC]
MKRHLTVITFIVIVSLLLFGCLDPHTKQTIGTKEMYVHITEHGQKKTIKDEKGDSFNRYYYQIKAYDENGKQEIVTFSAAKNLKLDSFLRVYVAKGKYKDGTKPISTYEEVKELEVPKKARVKIHG